MKQTLSLLQWNMGFKSPSISPTVRGSRLSLLQALLQDKSPSLIALQEAPDEAKVILRNANFSLASNEGLLQAFKTTDWTQEGPPITISRRAVGSGLNFTRGISRLAFWNVHITSRFRRQDIGISEEIRAVVRQIYNARGSAGWSGRLEVVSGDFNMAPYAEAVSFPSGFFASRSLIWATKRGRKAIPPEKALYNPTWTLLGKHTPPQGSFYAITEPDGPWYVYDQTLVSPELVKEGSSPIIEVIDAVQSIELCSTRKDRIPNSSVGSDHLPLLTRIEVE